MFYIFENRTTSILAVSKPISLDKYNSYYVCYIMSASPQPGQNSNGDLRLIGSPAGSGRLEIYISNQSRWGTVCDDYFNLFEGDIACRELYSCS